MSRPEEATETTAIVLPPPGIFNTTDSGDIVDSEDEHEFDEVAEDPELYTKGRLYPTYIGDVLADRYRIEHKLGHGGFSAVWMAHDVQSKKDVALKIMTSGLSGEQEYLMQDGISHAVSDTSRLLIYQDTFFVTGSSGCIHRVLVFPLQGPSLRDHARQKPAGARMLAAKQLLQGLKALHDGEIVHCDLNSANVMFGLSPLDMYDTATKYQYLGRPQKMILPSASTQHKPGELVMPMAPRKELVTNDVLLGDFGMSIPAGASVTQKWQSPLVYCAPERLHGEDPSFASDMWSYTCLLAELYLRCPLFWGAAPLRVITFVVKTLGPLPAQWKDLYQLGGKCDPEWYNQDRKPCSHLGLEHKIPHLRPEIDPTEVQLVLDILRWGLSYLPENRPTAAQLLDSDLFKDLMAIYGL